MRECFSCFNSTKSLHVYRIDTQRQRSRWFGKLLHLCSMRVWAEVFVQVFFLLLKYNSDNQFGGHHQWTESPNYSSQISEFIQTTLMVTRITGMKCRASRALKISSAATHAHTHRLSYTTSLLGNLNY